MSLSQRLGEYVAAAFTGIWIQSHEHPDALAEIGRLCHDRKWSSAVWDVDRGLQITGGSSTAAGNTNTATDPVAAIRSINTLAPGKDQPEGSALLVLPNFHRFMQSTEIIQALAHQIHSGKLNRTFIVILSPIVQIPVELEKHFVVVEHELPDKQQLQKIAQGVATEAGELPTGADLTRLLDAASGLTRYEAEGAFSLSLVREGKVKPETVWELKSQTLKKSGLLNLHRGVERFEQLGGLESLKRFCTRVLASNRTADTTTVTPAKPRGILLLGVPGTGKSAFAKALGNEMGRPTLALDVGSLLGGLVGSTEQNTRQALRIADAMSPCILFVDEIEKALSGAASSGSTDSGVSARLFGSLPTWLSDHTSDVFFIGTCNDISRLPPEFSRAERFDGVFFMDLPSSADKQPIWGQYLKLFQIPKQALPKDQDWTGAEIKSCCRLAALLDVSLAEAARHVVPVAVTAAESVEKLRAWASGRCLSASNPGIYTRNTEMPPTVGRKVNRPSSN
jgi:hypothetical protein